MGKYTATSVAVTLVGVIPAEPWAPVRRLLKWGAWLLGAVVLAVAGFFLVFAYTHADLKQVQGWVDSFRAEVTARLDAWAAQGESFGSEATGGAVAAPIARALIEADRDISQW